MLQIVRNREFSQACRALCGRRRQEALDTLLHTRDGQSAQISSVDRAALEAIYEAGQNVPGEEIIADYAEHYRGDCPYQDRRPFAARRAKARSLCSSAMAPCGSVNVEQLIRKPRWPVLEAVSALSGRVHPTRSGAAALEGVPVRHSNAGATTA